MAGAEYGSWRNMIWPIRLSTRAMPSSVCLVLSLLIDGSNRYHYSYSILSKTYHTVLH